MQNQRVMEYRGFTFENPELNNFESFRINRNYTSSFVNRNNVTKIFENFSDLFILDFNDRSFQFRPKVDGPKPLSKRKRSQRSEKKTYWTVCRICKDENERSFELMSTIMHESGRQIKTRPGIFAMFLIFE